MAEKRIRYNLLDEPLLGVEDATGRQKKVTLPGLLTRLSAGGAVALTAVQAHQQHPVHAFLVQLGAIAMNRGRLAEPPKTNRPGASC